ncbi:MAG: hypothetical protein ABIJ97_05920 [Bacteroidota bacterium]
MYRKIKNIVIWFLIVIYIIIVFGFISDEKAFISCKNIEIEIGDKEKYQFIKEKDVLDIFKNESLKIQGYPFDSIHPYIIEKILMSQPSVKSAEVYTTIDGIIRIFISQREPLLRIINFNNESYYIDKDGWLMPWSEKYTARVIVVSGNINEPYSIKYKKNVGNFADESNNRNSSLFKLYKLAQYIESNDFWKSQIQQIYINKDEEIELIPIVGNHIILLGDIDNFKEKLFNLKLVYEKGFSVEGWNNYKVINLKFKNQVVCTKIN